MRFVIELNAAKRGEALRDVFNICVDARNPGPATTRHQFGLRSDSTVKVNGTRRFPIPHYRECYDSIG